MAKIQISGSLLKQIFIVNQFNIPDMAIIFGGIRGAVMNSPLDNAYFNQMELNTIEVNYINPRCTMFQWHRIDNKIAFFPSSTVPYKDYVNSSMKHGGAGANCLIPGFYTDYIKGIHKNGQPTGHEAFKETGIHPIRRATNNSEYDDDDAINYENPYDDIHCGWFETIDVNYFSSAGCQVIMGLPHCPKRGSDDNTGPWKVFHDNAYQISQTLFPYILINAEEILFIINNSSQPIHPILKMGSTGPLVNKLQQALKNKGYFEGDIDGNFGWRTSKSVVQFQMATFGVNGTDGIVGVDTFTALNILQDKISLIV